MLSRQSATQSVHGHFLFRLGLVLVFLACSAGAVFGVLQFECCSNVAILVCTVPIAPYYWQKLNHEIPYLSLVVALSPVV